MPYISRVTITFARPSRASPPLHQAVGQLIRAWPYVPEIWRPTAFFLVLRRRLPIRMVLGWIVFVAQLDQYLRCDDPDCEESREVREAINSNITLARLQRRGRRMDRELRRLNRRSREHARRMNRLAPGAQDLGGYLRMVTRQITELTGESMPPQMMELLRSMGM